MTRLHRDDLWSVTPGDHASTVWAGTRIIHIVESRARDIVKMKCGQQGELRRYYTQANVHPMTTGTQLPVSCLFCLGAE